MSLPIKEVSQILVDNLKLRGSVLPISTKAATQWSDGLELKRGGETVLYTGMMYQIIPYINVLVKRLEMVDGTFLTKFTIFGRMANRFINVSKFMGSPSKEEVKQHNGTLNTVARLLKQARVDFGYLYEDDLYVGALTHDLGADEVVAEHAKKVFANFKKHGVKQVITVDPHTTNMLREIFPQMVPGFNLKVKSYLEVLSEKGVTPKKQQTGDVVLHDSCIYARHEGVIDSPRTLLSKTGINPRSPREGKKLTFCCGGPAESLFPGKALTVGKKRIAQLSKEGDNVAVMCPICYANLSRSCTNGTKVADIADYLKKGYLE